MPANRRFTYGTLAKAGFLLGLGLFALGVGGEWFLHSQAQQLPAWEDALFFDLEVIGVLVFSLSPFVFGIALPLIEG